MRFYPIVLTVLGFAFAAPLQAQQFRAAWADIFHAGLTSQSDVNTMISKLVAGRYNAVIVQVLGYMDNPTASHGAHWKSSIAPWSSRVTASFDPLAYVCQQAHANGIEVHAWLGGSGAAMYRVSTSWPPAGNSILAAHPEWMMVPWANSEGNAVVAINGNYMLDMGSSDAQQYIVSIVRELVTNYQIDGIHWDDEHGGTEYSAGLGFPAYSTTTYTNSGLARYRRNTGYVGTPTATDAAYNDYRRRFKNELIARCQAEIQSIKTNPRQPLRHTSATMAYGGPPATCTFTSEEAYTYYSDWPTMLQKGWLDAAIPMNYKTSANDSMYRNWCDRSYSCWRYNRHIYMGLGAYLNPKDYTITQLQYAYNAGLNGGVTYSYGVPSNDGGDWWSYVATNLYTNTATVPTMPWRSPATATEGIVWGRVKEGRTSSYLDDATVTVGGGPTVKTDGNGYYVATLVPATAGGTVRTVIASKSGMVVASTNATVLAGDIVRYDFVLRGYTAITLNPIATNPVCAGTAVSLTATVTGTNNPTGSVEYFDGAASLGTSALSGGSATKVVSGLSAGTHASITAAYLGDSANNPSTSSARSLTVSTPPTISAQPASATNCVGDSVTFIVAADNATAYQWRKGGANISGATLSSYTINPVGAGDVASYDCVLSGASPCASVTSSSASLTVSIPPAITAQPASTAACEGGSVTFSVAADNATAYQWRKGGANISGATLSSYTINPVGAGDAASYDCVLSGASPCASVTSSPASLTISVPPVITADPASTTNCVGDSVTFTVTADNAAAYQWRKDGAEISGATLSSYSINPAEAGDAANYDCVVLGSSPCGAVTSSPALLVLFQPPAIAVEPGALAAVPGGSVSFSMLATGSEPLSYQWYQGPTNGLLLAGATTAALTLTNLQPADFTNYTVVVANSCGSIASAPALLTVALSPSLTSPAFDGAAFTLTFPTEVGPAYYLEYKFNLEDPSWQPLTNLGGTGLPVTVTDDTATNASRFYRIQVR